LHNIAVKNFDDFLAPYEKFFGALELVAHRGQLNFNIELNKEFRLKYTRISLLMLDQQKSLKTTINDLLALNMITPVMTAYASAIVIVKKKDGTDRVCVDYRELNRITKRDLYPLPIIKILLQQMTCFQVFSKIDLSSAYHQIRLKPGCEKYTAFRCMYGTFQYRIVSFGTMNAQSHFERTLEYVLRDLLNESVFVYQDYILIATVDKKTH
jgi:Reverse transcriptase (RNA-dependent DNA polymerase)